jgi:hypothetical protein
MGRNTQTLKPGGAHIFSVPWYRHKPTLIRVRKHHDGSIEHLEKPDYHGNPIDAQGSLVVTEWGTDLPFVITKASQLPTAVFRYIDRGRGLDGEFMEIFASRKEGT